MVVIAGGEPLLHREIDEITRRMIAKKEVRLSLHQCAIARKEIGAVRTQPVLCLDRPSTMATETTTTLGLPDAACTIRRRRDQGGESPRLSVSTSTPLCSPRPTRSRIAHFLDDVTDIGIDGITVSPGYAYERAPDQEHFLNRRRTKELFERSSSATSGAVGLSTNLACSSISSQGTKTYHCTPWGNPTRNYFAGSAPAICWGRVTRRHSRS